MAGNTTDLSPTMFWQSGEPRNSTHLAAAGLFFEPTQIESASPLYMLARLPVGPDRRSARGRRSRSLLPASALVFHEPLVTIAYLPAVKIDDSSGPVTCGDAGHVALVDQRS